MSYPAEDDLLDRILLAGVESPGKATISNHVRAHKWDVKEADGQGGASTTHKGENVSQFTITFQLFDDPLAAVQDTQRWTDEFLPVLRSSTSGVKPLALDIYHPDLALLDIKSVCVKSIGGFAHDGLGGITVAVEFLEYRPPKPKKGSPKGSKSSKEKPEPDPLTKALNQLNDVLKEAEKP